MSSEKLLAMARDLYGTLPQERFWFPLEENRSSSPINFQHECDMQFLWRSMW
jgi:hypothetical protein